VFTNSLSFAEFMALGSCFLAVRLFGSRTTGDWVRFGLLNVLVLAALVYNGSRLGVVGATAGYATAGVLVVYRRWRENPGSIIASAALYFTPLAIAFGVAVFLFVGRIRKLFVGSGIQVTSTEARIEQFDKLPGPLLQRPVFGYGPGNGAEALDYHQPGGLLTVDTYIISLLLDYGVLGFIAFTGFLVSLFVMAVRLSLNLLNSRYLLSAALAATLMTFLVIRLVLSQEDNHTLFFFLVGLLFAEKYRSDVAQPSGEPER
jgi:O-antigen ligase